MAESFEEFMAAERELGRQAWAPAEAASRGWHQPHPWPPRSPAWRARPTAAAPAAQEASDA